MADSKRLLIIDGYPKKSREEFDVAGMKYAGILYEEMAQKYLPGAECDIIYSSDPGVTLPDEQGLSDYDGLLWPGCNLTVFKTDDERVARMLDLCRHAYNTGLPQFGTCWGIQIAVFVAGGEVAPNPKGREMGIGRKIALTEEGKKHPMFRGKPHVYCHFVSHDDEVTKLPDGARLLAGNDFSRIQAVDVKYKKGTFWGIQYHPEYDLNEMAGLIKAREKKLIDLGFFIGHDDMVTYAERLQKLHQEPNRKDLRWQLGIDDDIISDNIRQCEFKNWIDYFIGT